VVETIHFNGRFVWFPPSVRVILYLTNLPPHFLKTPATLLHKTKAIVLRTIPYGDTSLIVSAYTELFGLQSYIVKGARRVSKKGGGQAPYFQPSALLDLVVYHNDQKQLQIIKEIKWAYLYQYVLSNVLKNSVALFMVEMLSRCVKQPETNEELFQFVETNLRILDEGEPAVVANLPLHYSLQLAGQLGLRLEDNYSSNNIFLDLQEGRFVGKTPEHNFYLDGRLAEITFELLQMNNPVILYRLKLNKQMRHELLQAYEYFFQFHLQDFGYLRTVKILEAVLG
jgi:DNA repair protein RecO (recombination protein O)